MGKAKKKKGYSLIESLVAFGILLLGIVPVINIATYAITFHHRAGEVEEASRLSQTVIDYIKSRGYDELKNRIDTGNIVTSGKNYNITLVSGETYFTIEEFGDDFGISQDLVLLNSKGLNLEQIKVYLRLSKGNDIAKLKKTDETSETNYTYYPTGEFQPGGSEANAYNDELIYGRIIFGYGDEKTSNLSQKEKELVTTFVVTPIENWK